MKIIKHGNQYGPRFTCPTCGCVFIANEDEYEQNHMLVDNMACGTARIIYLYHYTCKCPECGKVCTATDRDDK